MMDGSKKRWRKPEPIDVKEEIEKLNTSMCNRIVNVTNCYDLMTIRRQKLAK